MHSPKLFPSPIFHIWLDRDFPSGKRLWITEFVAVFAAPTDVAALAAAWAAAWAAAATAAAAVEAAEAAEAAQVAKSPHLRTSSVLWLWPGRAKKRVRLRAFKYVGEDEKVGGRKELPSSAHLNKPFKMVSFKIGKRSRPHFASFCESEDFFLPMHSGGFAQLCLFCPAYDLATGASIVLSYARCWTCLCTASDGVTTIVGAAHVVLHVRGQHLRHCPTGCSLRSTARACAR